jgi:hemerythrin-like metal-binding protein
MPALAWSDALSLHQPQMDDTHQDFVALLGAVEAAVNAPRDELLAHLDRFIAHTEAHFGQEDAWMAAIGFQPGNCHARQHVEVLELMREVRRRAADEGQVELVGRLVPALAEWFVPHAQAMDGGLALVMAETGFDVATGTMQRPPDATDDTVFEPARAAG